MSRTKAINELKSLIVVAPEHLRADLRGLGLARQLDRIDRLPSASAATIEHRVTLRTLRSIAARVRFLTNQATELDIELAALVPQHPAGPTLLGEAGVDPSWLPSSWSAGLTADAFATRQRSRPWPVLPRWRPAAANAPGTG